MKKTFLSQLIGYAVPYKKSLLMVLISLMLTSGAVLSIGKSIEYIIDHGLSKNNIEAYDQSLIYLFSIVLVLAVFTFIRFYLITKTGEAIVADIRRDFFKHIIHLSPSFFETRGSGEVISRMTSDATIIQGVIGSTTSVAARNIITLIGGILMLSAISIKLTAAIFAFIPLILAPIIFFGRKVRRFTKESQDKLGELSSLCEQSIHYVRSIQAYRREDFEFEKFNHKLQDQLNTSYQRITLRSVLTALAISLSFGGVIFVLWIGGHQVLLGELTAGELSAFVFISVICAGAAGAISEVFGEFQKAVGASERIFEFLNTPSEINELENIAEFKSINPIITLNDVVFAYAANQDKKILNGFTIKFLPGKLNALVGKSGAGKSTVFSLLQRFYEVSSGEIAIDGVDIKQMKLSDLRKNFTYVSQDPVIFSTTVYENIRYGKLDATENEILKAAEQAECMDFITSMPQGIHSDIGDKGVRLSGGQKQRIAIARAILNDPKILLLDEATSSLDSENERKVQKAIEHLIKDRTCIVIAHRLSTIQQADQIIVLNEGAVVECGNHQELMKKDGLYAHLANNPDVAEI